MTEWQEQVLIAGMRIGRLGFNRHVTKPDHAADVHQIAGQVRLRLERDHPAIPDPTRKPIGEATLVGADITDDIARTEMPPDCDELRSLIAKEGLQRANPKPDALGREPSLENRHRLALSIFLAQHLASFKIGQELQLLEVRVGSKAPILTVGKPLQVFLD